MKCKTRALLEDALIRELSQNGIAEPVRVYRPALEARFALDGTSNEFDYEYVFSWGVPGADFLLTYNLMDERGCLKKSLAPLEIDRFILSGNGQEYVKLNTASQDRTIYLRHSMIKFVKRGDEVSRLVEMDFPINLQTDNLRNLLKGRPTIETFAKEVVKTLMGAA